LQIGNENAVGMKSDLPDRRENLLLRPYPAERWIGQLDMLRPIIRLAKCGSVLKPQHSMRVLAPGEKRKYRSLGVRRSGVLDDVLQLLTRINLRVGDITQFHFGRPVLRQTQPIFARGGEAMAGVKKRFGRRFLNLSANRGAEECEHDEGKAFQGGTPNRRSFAVIRYVR
jgi:hypothetical protein